MRFTSVGEILQAFEVQEVRLATELATGESLRPVRAAMVAKRGECELPSGIVLDFEHPWDAPVGICPALLRAMRPFLIAAAMGLTSAEAEGYLVSCPSCRLYILCKPDDSQPRSGGRMPGLAGSFSKKDAIARSGMVRSSVYIGSKGYQQSVAYGLWRRRNG